MNIHTTMRKAAQFAAATAVLLVAMQGIALAQTPKTSCESLAKLALPDTTITLAQTVAAGEFVEPEHIEFRIGNEVPLAGSGAAGANGEARPAQAGPPRADTSYTKKLPAFCRIAATLKPSADSNIHIEVWMPAAGWNGKLLGVGNGGWAGKLMYGPAFYGATGLSAGLMQGYAAVSTDTGHDDSKREETSGLFAIGHPEKLIDYGYRAVHLMTVEAKSFIQAYYGAAPKHSYFQGASLGGYQAITAAERYPEDYDGIVAGWPANPMVFFNAQQIWPSWLISKNPARFIPKEKYAMIHEAVVRKCDELDGLKDGILENPAACPFDPKELVCKGSEAADCITETQADFLRMVYKGPTNPRTGQVYYPGAPLGAEPTIYSEATGNVRQTPLALFQDVAFQDLKWDWKTLDFDKDIDKAVEVTSKVFFARPNLQAFTARGGKLFLHINWANYHSPQQLIDYYNEAAQKIGADKTRTSIRLFNVPASNVGGSPRYDGLALMDNWVESGKAPDQIVTTFSQNGQDVRTHPVCAYPAVARYAGSGNTAEAANYFCAAPKGATKP